VRPLLGRPSSSAQATPCTEVSRVCKHALEEAATFKRQTVDIHVRLHDLYHEGVTRNNLAITLIELKRYDEARHELHRAIECKQPYGHVATPWDTWQLLHMLEQTIGNSQAAAQARQQAVESYLAYRRAGGESQMPGTKLCARVAQAIQEGKTAEMEQLLDQNFGADAEPWARAMIPKLQAILRGDRDPVLATDPGLYYQDAAELHLLLEALEQARR